MVTVADILEFLESIAPLSMKEDWDRVGLNCGRINQPVTKVLVSLDPSPEACEEAVQTGAQLLLTHHALIWEAGFVNDSTQQGRSVLKLIENGISHINAHTNLDCAPGGVNDILAKKLGLQDIQVIAPKGKDAQGRPWGLLRMGTVSSQSLDTFLPYVKEQLGCDGLRFVEGTKTVSRVAVGGGACAGEMQQVIDAGCDTFVTADAKYNHFWDARNAGLNLIDAGHFHTENPVCGYLAEQLQKAFPELTVCVSEKHNECTKFFC